MANKTIELGANRVLKVKLPDVYFNILYSMASLEGRDIEGKGPDELAAEFIQQAIKEDILGDEGYWGHLITKGWKEDLKGDPYWEGKE